MTRASHSRTLVRRTSEMLFEQIEDLDCRISTENGGEKLVHGSGGMVSLRAEQNSAR